MSRNSARDKLVDQLVSVVDPNALVLLNSFAEGDMNVRNMEHFIDTHTFDATDVPHYIEWGDADILARSADGATEDAPPLRPDLLNSPYMRGHLRRFLTRMRTLSRRLLVCAAWVLDRDAMAQWMAAFLAAATEAERVALPPPFGVVEPADCVFLNVLPPPRAAGGAPVQALELRVDWPGARTTRDRQRRDEAPLVPAGVEVFVHTEPQLGFYRPEAALLGDYAVRAARDFADVPAREAYRSYADGNTPLVAPNSPFFEVMRLKQQLAEATTHRAQANGTVSQGHVIVQIETVKPTAANERYLTDNERAMLHPTDAMLANLNQTQQMTYEDWRARHDALQESIKTLEGRRPAGSGSVPSSQLTRAYFNRPHPHENILDLPEGVTLAHVHAPSSLIDVDVLRRDYRQSVADALGLSITVYDELARAPAGSSNSGFAGVVNPTRDTPAERSLQQLVQTERTWHAALFEKLYARLFNALDLQLIDAMHAHLHARVDDMRRAKQAARTIERAIAREMDETGGRGVVKDDPAVRQELAETRAAAGSKAERRHGKMRVRELRALFERLHVRHSSYARLVFQPSRSEHTAMQLGALLDFYDRGLVSPEALVPFVKVVFGNVPINTQAVLPATVSPLDPVEPGMPTQPPKRKRVATAGSEGLPAKRARGSAD